MCSHLLPTIRLCPFTISYSPRVANPTETSSRSEGSLAAEDHPLLGAGEESANRRQVISIDTIPDDVLHEIFNHCLHDSLLEGGRQKAWQSLAHVCHRWRQIVFESKCRLDLRLVCTGRTPARDTLDVWPALPLIIQCDGWQPIQSVDNITAVLEHGDRVRRIYLTSVPGSDMEAILATMQRPFPELAFLRLWADDPVSVVVPDSFLGGSAPNLELLLLSRIPFPGLPNLFLSATRLTEVYLQNIPHSGYISPNTMATALSALTNLSNLSLEFQSPRSCPDQAGRRPPPSTRSVLPVFTEFWFKGASEYLEDLVACINAPRLNKLNIEFFNDIMFDAPQLMQFITRTPKSKAFEKAHITLSDDAATVDFSSQKSRYGDFRVEILCKGLEWQVSSLGQVCTWCLPQAPLSMLEDLYFRKERYMRGVWTGNIDSGLWLELLQPFSGVKNLYLSEEFASRIVPALQELVEGRTTEVLPTLEKIFLGGLKSSGPVHKGIGQFVSAREVAGHPTIVVSGWTDEEQTII